jgi:hypothetical protein
VASKFLNHTCIMRILRAGLHYGPVVIFHKVPNMSRDMFLKKISVDRFLENEPVFGRVKFTLDGF